MQEMGFRGATDAANQPNIQPVSTSNRYPVDAGAGTAGSPSGGVQSVQGVPAGTPVNVADMPRGIAAVFTTLTRPANTTPYAANDSISNNATATSVTALSATASDANDGPVVLTSVEVDTNDTGLGNGVSIRAYVYNLDPTSNGGVGGGDNAAFSNKRSGLVATFSGAFHAMSDGGKAFLAPEDTGPPVLPPTSGGRTLYIQYQTMGSFTPSANSTTLVATARGYQLRA